MSLIHDALNRAKQAQQNAPPPPSAGPAFQPVDPAQFTRRGAGLMMQLSLAAVALMALLLVWQFARHQSSNLPVQARTPAPEPLPPATPAATAPLPVLTPAAPSADAAATNAALQNATQITAKSTAEATNAVAAVEAPPKPAPLKLQAILLNPRRPSAIISGRTVFIGDRVGDLRVAAIDQDSATLVGAGERKVLRLGD